MVSDSLSWLYFENDIIPTTCIKNITSPIIKQTDDKLNSDPYSDIIECFNESNYSLILTFDFIFMILFLIIQIVIVLFLFIIL